MLKQLAVSVFFALSFALSFSAHGSRLERHQAAVKTMEDLHFFSEGRGMMLSPGLIRAYNLFVPGLGVVNRERFERRWGVVYNESDKISGLHDVEYKGHQVGVMGCVVCHSGRAAGQFIVGLGNKNIDVFQMGVDVNRIERYWRALVPGLMKDDAYKDMEKAALAFSGYLANERLGNLTQGLVPISFIRGWFYRIHKQDVPQDMHKGQVKVPMLWGYGEKRLVGQFCDGYGDGRELGWAVAVELAAGQTVEAVRKYYPKARAAEEEFEYLLPPRYPFEVNSKLASEGHQFFNQTCARCHGTYERDSEGQPVFKEPLWIPSVVVRTDMDRVAGHSSDFNLLVDTSPLKDVMAWNKAEHGYFAPRLDGIWSRFPYLHNGSVPSLSALLTPEAERPRLFSMRDAGELYRFDKKRVGLTSPQNVEERRHLLEGAKRGARDVYDTSRVGHSNVGHDFYTDVDEATKLAVIEYLKTL